MASARFERQFVVGGLALALLVAQSLAGAGWVQAQVLPDATLPEGERSRLMPNIVIGGQLSDRIDGGSRQGSALFHSFFDFNVNADQRLFFANPSGIEAIFSRVTGTNSSDILGTLGVQGGADLYLLNPNGIVFGPNARLDISGSFFASTANSLIIGNDFQWGIASAEQPALLNVGVEPGLQWGSLGSNSIVSNGQLSTGQDLQLAAHELDLQGQLQAGQDLTLRATDGALLRDSAATPLIARAGEDFVVQGDRSLQLSTLNHLDSGLFAGDNLTLRSAAPIQGDARYGSGGSLRFETLEGQLSDVWSPNDPVIRSQGDVSFNSYTGTSLHILAGGSVEIPGAVTITGPGTAGTALQEIVTLSDQETQVAIDGSQFPTLDVRAGLANVETIGIIGGSNGFNPAPQIGGSSSTEGNVRIGNIAITAPEGLVFLSTNSVDASADRSTFGTVEVGEILTGGPRFSGNGGSVIIDATGDINITGDIDASSLQENGGKIRLFTQGNLTSEDISSSSQGNIQAVALRAILEFIARDNIFDGIDIVQQAISEVELQGNGGNIELSAIGSIETQDIDSIGFRSGEIILQSDQPLSLENSSILNASSSPQAESRIFIDVPSLVLRDSGSILALQLGQGKGSSITIDAPQSISIASRSESSLLIGLDLGERLSSIANIFRLISPAGNYIATSAVRETGFAGDIEIATQELVIRNDAAPLDPNRPFVLRRQRFLSDSPFAGISSAAIFSSLGNAGQIKISANSIDIAGNLPGPFVPTPDESNQLSREQVRTLSVLDSIATGITASGAVVSTSSGSPGSIQIDTEKLSIRDGAGITLSSPGVSSASASQARLEINAADQIELVGKAVITSATNGAGPAADLKLTVSPEGQGLFLSDGAFIQADTLVLDPENLPNLQAGPAGDITIQTPQLQLTNEAFIGAISGTQGGAAGDLTINAGQISLSDSLISANTLEGQAGSLNLNATESILLEGQLRSGPANEAGGLFAGATEGGNGGRLSIATPRLIVRDQAAVVASTVSGIGGDITLDGLSQLRVEDSVITAATESGAAGNIAVEADSVSLLGELQADTAGNLRSDSSGSLQSNRPSGISVEATGDGNAGLLSVQAGDVELRDGAALTVSSLGQGQGGELTVQAQWLSLDNQGRLAATTASGEGGNINLDIAQLLTLRRNSQIETDAQGGSGNGGDITITNRDGFILGLPEEDSDITANAIAGRGGNIDITTQGIFGLEFRPERTPQSDITASSEVGVNGNVTIDQLSPDPAQGLDELPANFVDGSRIIAQNLCRDGRGSEFIVTGRGGLPKAPGDAFEADLFWEDWRTGQQKPGQQKPVTSAGSVNAALIQKRALVKREAEGEGEAIAMIEAQGWSRNASGAVKLGLEKPEGYRTDWVQAANCRSTKPIMKPLAQTPPPSSPGPLPPSLGEGEFQSPSISIESKGD